MVYSSGLENRQAERLREFESPPLRQIKNMTHVVIFLICHHSIDAVGVLI